MHRIRDGSIQALDGHIHLRTYVGDGSLDAGVPFLERRGGGLVHINAPVLLELGLPEAQVLQIEDALFEVTDAVEEVPALVVDDDGGGLLGGSVVLQGAEAFTDSRVKMLAARL